MRVQTAPKRQITSMHLRRRARHYRLAAAVSDVRWNEDTFLDLATMFERLSEHFARAEARPHSL